MKSIATTIAVLMAAHSIASTQSAPKLPKDAETLRTSYLDARQRALQPLDQKYLTELEKLLAAHTKAGHLDDAISIRAEIATIVPTSEDPRLPKSDAGGKRALEKDIAGSKWQFFDSVGTGSEATRGLVSFNHDGSCKPDWGSAARWEVTKAGILKFMFGSRWECEMHQIDANTFEGLGVGEASKDAGGGKVRLTRMQ